MHAKRTGGFVAGALAGISPVSAARNGSDSSHGRVRVIPAAPRRNVRRETDWLQEKAAPAFMVIYVASLRCVCTNEMGLSMNRTPSPLPSPPSGGEGVRRTGEGE